MNQMTRISVEAFGNANVVSFNDRKILDANAIEELGGELFSLVGSSTLILDFTGVEFLSSAALQKMIDLDRKIKAAGGSLKMCCLRHDIMEVFKLTRLDRLFDIKKDRSEALAVMT